jgi:hypothetical protein
VVQNSYRRDRWALQPRRVEVWSEKGTVRGTVAPVLEEYGVTFRVMHGYGSATALYGAAGETAAHDAPLCVFYVGDWDPSGLHMSEVDLPRRLDRYGGNVEFIRAALTEPDVRDPSLPSFDADTKRNDPRWPWFTDRYGERCWELDALSPVVLRARVEQLVRERIAWEPWKRCGLAEQAERESLHGVLGQWRRVAFSWPATE